MNYSSSTNMNYRLKSMRSFDCAHYARLAQDDIYAEANMNYSAKPNVKINE